MTAALEPVLSQVAGLPGAPARINQAAATHQQRPGNTVNIGPTGSISGTPPVFRQVLPDQL